MEPRPLVNTIKVLHLEDSILDHQMTCRALEKAGVQFTAIRVETLDAFGAELRNCAFDIVLADYRLPGFTALDAWNQMAHRQAECPFVILSGTIGEAAAVAAIHQGISDYLHKDELPKLARVVWRTLDVHRTRQAKRQAHKDLEQSEQRLAEFAAHLQSTIESERASIAREIHDDIGGSLAAVKLDIGWISRRTDDADIQSHLKSANDMLQHAIGASQRIMMSLQPEILDQGLLAALQWLAHGFERRTNIETRLTNSSSLLLLPKPVKLTAFRTTQEALTNISKYAQCSVVRIDVSDAGGVLTLEIADNGVGITEGAMDKPQSMGLRGLRERAKTVGGWLDISTSAARGTAITLTVPLDANQGYSKEDT
ncbi:hybrid sensor histidine kinase/response regulator [Rhodoferax aquaticus]|uniref:Response regulator n=1 Tax=Rhodoferax aquaticus TaxID=2527691 RepID=A0A515ETW2_9BURK|nr:ATP-binding protein [Rhodoferax aquaticus]QDL56058.1 response regulator [Rhodoferax aquaticus]